MSTMTSNASDHTTKLDRLNSPVSQAIRPYTHSDIDTQSVGSRLSKLTYKDYPEAPPTNSLCSSTFTVRTLSSTASKASTTATVVERRKKFDTYAPKRLVDWRWLALLCIFLFLPTGLIAFGFARKSQIKYKDGFTDESRQLNKHALTLCIISVICGVGLLFGSFYGLDSWPQTNG